jgi:hypothetical protein
MLSLASRFGCGTRRPFYQFRNMDDSEEDLTKLVKQLAKTVPGLELDDDVLKLRVAAFRASEAEILKGMTSGGKTKTETKHEMEESAVAKLSEELKVLPMRVIQRLSETDRHFRRRRRYSPMLIEDLLHTSGARGDPISILVAASVFRDDAPWLYELTVDVHRALNRGSTGEVTRAMKRFRRASELMRRGPFLEELGGGGRDLHMLVMEFPRMLEHIVARNLESRKSRRAAAASEKSALESSGS